MGQAGGRGCVPRGGGGGSGGVERRELVDKIGCKQQVFIGAGGPENGAVVTNSRHLSRPSWDGHAPLQPLQNAFFSQLPQVRIRTGGCPRPGKKAAQSRRFLAENHYFHLDPKVPI